jgi:hypothetical protein
MLADSMRGLLTQVVWLLTIVLPLLAVSMLFTPAERCMPMWLTGQQLGTMLTCSFMAATALMKLHTARAKDRVLDTGYLVFAFLVR